MTTSDDRSAPESDATALPQAPPQVDASPVTAPPADAPDDLDPDAGLIRRAEKALADLFGFDGFRDAQVPIVASVLRGENLLVVMPTGAGKSLIYQLPALARRGLTLVISPLIALMKDQVDGLRAHGLGHFVGAIHSGMSTAEQADTMDRAAAGDLRLLYVAPERFGARNFQSLLARTPIRMLAIDEAHCISQWGHDFRPDYTRIAAIVEQYKPQQILGLTATATPDVRDDIRAQLGHGLRAVVSGFRRDNLFFDVRHTRRKRDKLQEIELLHRSLGRHGIVYCSTRRNVDHVADGLLQSGLTVARYHGGMDAGERTAQQERFQAGQVDAIVATNAFGMGVDKSDVRWIAHYDTPGSLEAYYQEAGRAGRDGKPSRCMLLYSPRDLEIQKQFLDGENPSPAAYREVWQKLVDHPGDVVEQTRAEMAEGLTHLRSDYAVSTVMKNLGKAGLVRRMYDHRASAAVKLVGHGRFKADSARGMLYRWLHNREGSREAGVSFEPEALAEELDLTGAQLKTAIRALQEKELIVYEPPFRGRAIRIESRAPAEELPLDWDALAKKRAAAEKKLADMVSYAENSRCRHQTLVAYFGQEAEVCGDGCDVCVRQEVMLSQGGATVGTNGEAGATSTGTPAISERAFHVVFDILRTAKLMNGTFGSRRISQVVGGSGNKQLKDWRLDQLPTFASHPHLRQELLNDAIDVLMSFGVLELYRRQSSDDHQRCRLSERGAEILARQDTSLIPAVAAIAALDMRSAAGVRAAATKSPSAAGGRDAAGPAHAHDEEALELEAALRQLRRFLAERDGIPPYRVYPNYTLDNLVDTRPASKPALANVKGIGPSTLDNYGDAILAALATGKFTPPGAEAPADATRANAPAARATTTPSPKPGPAASSSGEAEATGSGSGSDNGPLDSETSETPQLPATDMEGPRYPLDAKPVDAPAALAAPASRSLPTAPKPVQPAPAAPPSLPSPVLSPLLASRPDEITDKDMTAETLRRLGSGLTPAAIARVEATSLTRVLRTIEEAAAAGQHVPIAQCVPQVVLDEARTRFPSNAAEPADAPAVHEAFPDLAFDEAALVAIWLRWDPA